jgi:hypothetical protein
MDDIFIAVALGCAAKLTHASKEAPKELGLLAGAIVFFSVLDFIFEVTRFVNWRGSSNLVIVTTLFIDMILLPAWLIRLAFWLRNDDVAGVMNEAMDHAKSAAATAAPVLAAGAAATVAAAACAASTAGSAGAQIQRATGVTLPKDLPLLGGKQKEDGGSAGASVKLEDDEAEGVPELV